MNIPLILTTLLVLCSAQEVAASEQSALVDFGKKVIRFFLGALLFIWGIN